MAKRRAWAIIDRRGKIHIDKICVSKSEAWGLLADELAPYSGSPATPTNTEMAARGYDCVRVEIRTGYEPR